MFVCQWLTVRSTAMVSGLTSSTPHPRWPVTPRRSARRSSVTGCRPWGRTSCHTSTSRSRGCCSVWVSTSRLFWWEIQMGMICRSDRRRREQKGEREKEKEEEEEEEMYISAGLSLTSAKRINFFLARKRSNLQMALPVCVVWTFHRCKAYMFWSFVFSVHLVELALYIYLYSEMCALIFFSWTLTVWPLIRRSFFFWLNKITIWKLWILCPWCCFCSCCSQAACSRTKMRGTPCLGHRCAYV